MQTKREFPRKVLRVQGNIKRARNQSVTDGQGAPGVLERYAKLMLNQYAGFKHD